MPNCKEKQREKNKKAKNKKLNEKKILYLSKENPMNQVDVKIVTT